MMGDLPAMDPCPFGKDSRHALMALYVDDIARADTSDLTLACQHCGALRRVPLTGAMVASRLDDATAEQIMDAVTGGPWEAR